jgi:nucleotide-binding universal stress UspA family protein
VRAIWERIARNRMDMTFSTIMVHLDIDRPDDACLRIAGDLAEQFDAKLIGVAAADLESSYYEQGVFAQELFEQLRSDIAKRLAEAEERFRSVASQHARQIEWRSAMARPVDYVSREARAADLIVTGAIRDGLLSNRPGRLYPGDLVMRAGRPILVVPPEAENLQLNCAMVAWKESREARRAVSDALPLLRKAKEVVIAEAIEDEADRTAARRLDDVASWLGRHGVAASGRVFHFPGGEDPLEKLWEYGADLLVAGAYGHARLREWVFGGFTHDLLRRSLRCAFLAH